MLREAIANCRNAGRDRGPRLRNWIEGAATAWEAFFRDAIRKKFRGEIALARAFNRDPMILVGGF
ncbi:hypothetical protein MKK65_00805 [Methylobacterium sp. J-001]|uniref:hypothetical protein n=1 Tax=Methylobacterium sp. J-001 TaxID=2836609 RepID=UPI001FBA2525|nr:hypothetical protein [Methylobacterium sp. J-001]MCJ2115151.1 hypothetical protein [Methylobacterium sp. J-001]